MATGKNLVKLPSHRQCSAVRLGTPLGRAQYSASAGCFQRAVSDEFNRGIQSWSKVQDGYVQPGGRLAFRHMRQTLNYFKANCCNIVEFRWVDFLTLRKLSKFVPHLNNRQIHNVGKLFVEMKAGLVVETTDKGFCPVRI